MINKSNFSRIFSLGVAVAAIVFVSGIFTQGFAQDPFRKPGYAIPRKVGVGGPAKPVKVGPPPVMPIGAPPIEQRIEYYKRLREEAVANDTPVPKVTSVLTLSEMAVTGIFRTPRGYAAMVEATPIKLSYAIYPGEKFFDGQLVAIEENRLIFRKVLKMSNGKFVASVENKALRQYTTQETVQGTAPAQGGEKPVETAVNVVPTSPENRTVPSSSIVSPVDEMSKQPEEQPAKEPATKTKPTRGSAGAKKPVKVAAAGSKVKHE
jgi:hypothetical protein